MFVEESDKIDNKGKDNTEEREENQDEAGSSSTDNIWSGPAKIVEEKSRYSNIKIDQDIVLFFLLHIYICMSYCGFSFICLLFCKKDRFSTKLH